MASESAIPTVPMPRRAGAYTFAAIFAVESFARALNSTVVSLQAYDILGSSQRVSVLSTSMSILVLVTTLMLPVVLGHMRRRWAYTTGVILLMLASLALGTHMLGGQALGMWLRNTGAAVLNITLSLYILDHIKRTDLARAEPLRLSLSTFSWMTGPALGVWLYVNHGPWGPQIMVLITTIGLLALFWFLRLSDHSGALPKGTMEGFSPLQNIRRFMAQPRLRLAWLIAFGRSMFWTTFFIYGPLMVVESGLSKNVSGLMISVSQLLLVAAWLFGRVALRHGVRVVIAGCFLFGSASAILAGLMGTAAPHAAILFLLTGSIAAAGLDGVGGIPFLRAVRHHERQKMTAVYRSYIDFSELVPGFIFSFVLLYFPIGSVFVILGAALAVIGLVSWQSLPKSM